MHSYNIILCVVKIFCARRPQLRGTLCWERSLYMPEVIKNNSIVLMLNFLHFKAFKIRGKNLVYLI